MGFILGIESSCDETGIALMDKKGNLLCNLISSQVELHRPFHGVVPELAARAHLQNLPLLFEKARSIYPQALQDLDAIAVTRGPGLIPALLVGVHFARAYAWAKRLPLIGINHLEAHLFSPFIGKKVPASFLGLVVSGSHASCYEVTPQGIFRLNRTRDDAPGEVFDKVAKMFKLPYPGGPVIDKLAQQGNPSRYTFKRPKMRDGSWDFSFSGLKSAVYRQVEGDTSWWHQDGSLTQKALDLLASFQEAVVVQLMHRLKTFYASHPQRVLSVSGGVAANTALQKAIHQWAEQTKVEVFFPPKDLITDNAGMVAFRGWMLYQEGYQDDPLTLDGDPQLGQL